MHSSPFLTLLIHVGRVRLLSNDATQERGAAIQAPPAAAAVAMHRGRADEAERDQDVADVDEADKWLDRHLDDPNATEIYDLRVRSA